MSVLYSGRSKNSNSSFGNIKIKSNTASTGLASERTLKISRVEQQSKTLAFTLKKQLFPKGEVRKIKKVNAEIQQKKLCETIHRHYSSLDTMRVNDKSVNKIVFNDSQNNDQKKLKTQSDEKIFTNKPFPIQVKSSSQKNKFSQSSILSYGLATCKGLYNITNNHLILINLGLIKEFYLIECIDGIEAGMFVKKNISYFLLKQYLSSQQKSNNKNKINTLQPAVLKTFQTLQHKIRQQQQKSHNNSGCFITAVLTINNHILTINCGLGSSIMFSKTQKILKTSEVHSTSNQKQLKRIINSGCQFYRTQFNIKYKQKLSIKGPLRLYPSGNSFTRIIGKTFDKIAHSQSNESQNLNPESFSNQVILSKPQMTFIKAQQIQFMLIASSGLEQFLKMSLICSIVLHEIKKYAQSFSIHDLAGQCAKQILSQAYLRGYNQTSTVIIVFYGIDIEAIKQKQRQNKQKTQNKSNFKSPLKYVGSKKSFCQYQKP